MLLCRRGGELDPTRHELVVRLPHVVALERERLELADAVGAAVGSEEHQLGVSTGWLELDPAL